MLMLNKVELRAKKISKDRNIRTLHKEYRVEPLGEEDLLRRSWQPTLTFFPGESPWTEEPGRLYSPWGHKELDMTEVS